MVSKINTGLPMTMVETKIRQEPWDVQARLAQMKLSLLGLLKVRAVALAAAADTTIFHPANAAGTFAYQHGTWALRDGFVGEIWRVDRTDGVEAIRNEANKVKVVFANVDVAASLAQDPKPRSRKGAGAERVFEPNLFGWLPSYAPEQKDGWAVFYLMVADNGAVELTQPIVKDGTFTRYVERIFLSDGSDLDRSPLALDDDDVADNFDPQVARK
jgi:hypothetical protein